MGIFLHNLEMPTGNDELRLIIRSNGQVIISHKTYYEEAEAVHVPPHCRLIDADALMKSVEKWLPSDPCGKEEKEYPFETDICISMLMEIDDAPTIIPASEDSET